jgi:predicted transcriptional regulator
MPAKVTDGARRATAIGTALKTVREALIPRVSQAELGRRANITQQMVSRYEAGMFEPSISTVYDLESALEVAHGSVLREAGMIEDGTSAVHMIRIDPSLTEEMRAVVLETYAIAVMQSKKIRGHPVPVQRRTRSRSA